MTRATNYIATVKTGDGVGSTSLRQARVVDMAALALLPQSVRFLLNELAIKLSSERVLAYYGSIARQARERNASVYDAEVWTCRKLAAMEADDLDRFAAVYRATHGHPLPHDAANASVQRYGPLALRPQRRMPARRGMSLARMMRLEVPEYAA